MCGLGRRHPHRVSQRWRDGAAKQQTGRRLGRLASAHARDSAIDPRSENQGLYVRADDHDRALLR